MSEKLKSIEFKKAHFISSFAGGEKLPPLPHFPQIAMVGKSNVGKSSLINHLTGSHELARVSATPGKTQLINFFSIDEKLVLVDLPGYGFAKVPFEVQKAWTEAITSYLEIAQLDLILLLIDSRRSIEEDDKQFIEWALLNEKPLVIIWTKCDKLSPAEKRKVIQESLAPIEQLTYSVKDSVGRAALIQTIRRILWG